MTQSQCDVPRFPGAANFRAEFSEVFPETPGILRYLLIVHCVATRLLCAPVVTTLWESNPLESKQANPPFNPFRGELGGASQLLGRKPPISGGVP